jgi:hypothetical protein
MSGRWQDWAKLAVALALLGGGIAMLHVASPHAPGPLGRTYSRNLTLKSDPRALFYTEVGSVSDFLDAQGRYGQVGRSYPATVCTSPHNPAATATRPTP